MARNEPRRYDSVAMTLHWLTALLVIANLALGISMVPLPLSPRKLNWYQWHKWIGITVLLVTWARLAWRAGHRPQPPAPMPDWQRRAATVSHALMYVLLAIIPVSGWLYSSSTGVEVVYLGVVALPDLVPKDRTLASVLKWIHFGLNSTLFTVVMVHAAAALRHRFADRDATLSRMLPGARTKGEWR